MKKRRKWWAINPKKIDKEVFDEVAKAIKVVAKNPPSPYGFERTDVLREIRANEDKYPALVFVKMKTFDELINYVLRKKGYVFEYVNDFSKGYCRRTVYWYPKRLRYSKKGSPRYKAITARTLQSKK